MICRDPKWSPDGKKIVFVGIKGKYSNLYLIEPDGNGLKQITYNEMDREPTFSPDGKKIAFTRTRNNKDDIWIMDAGGNNQKQITCGEGDNVLPCWIR